MMKVTEWVAEYESGHIKYYEGTREDAIGYFNASVFYDGNYELRINL